MKGRVGFICAGAVLVLAMYSPSSAKAGVAQQTYPSGYMASVVAQKQAKQPTQEFQGTVAKAGTKYVLEDKASGATYQLDNQDKAKEFVDKDVKVTGTLDPSTNTIQVSAIEEVK